MIRNRLFGCLERLVQEKGSILNDPHSVRGLVFFDIQTARGAFET